MSNYKSVCSSCWIRGYRKRQKFQGWKVSRFAGLIRYVGKSFAILSITTFIHSWLSDSKKQLRAFQQKFDIPHMNSPKKLSLVYSEMDESIHYWHVCADFPGLQLKPRYYRIRTIIFMVRSKSKMKQIANHFLVSFFCM